MAEPTLPSTSAPSFLSSSSHRASSYQDCAGGQAPRLPYATSPISASSGRAPSIPLLAPGLPHRHLAREAYRHRRAVDLSFSLPNTSTFLVMTTPPIPSSSSPLTPTAPSPTTAAGSFTTIPPLQPLPGGHLRVQVDSAGERKSPSIPRPVSLLSLSASPSFSGFFDSELAVAELAIPRYSSQSWSPKLAPDATGASWGLYAHGYGSFWEDSARREPGDWEAIHRVLRMGRVPR